MTPYKFLFIAIFLLTANMLTANPQVTIGGEEFSSSDIDTFADRQRLILGIRNPEAEWNRGREVASALQFILSEGARVYTTALVEEADLSPEELAQASNQLSTTGLLVGYERPLALRNHHLRKTLELLPPPADRTEKVLRETYQQQIVPVPVVRGYSMRDWMVLASDTVATSPSLTLPASREEFAALNEEGIRAMLSRQKVGRELAASQLGDPQKRRAAREALLQGGNDEVTPQQEALLLILQQAALHRHQWFAKNVVVHEEVVATFWERYLEKEEEVGSQSRLVREVNGGLPLLVGP